MPNRLTRSVALATGLVLVTAGLAAANDRTLTEDGGAAVDPAVFERVHDQQGGDDGHLPSSSQNVRLVGKMRINQDQEGRVADVGALGNYAYVAAWAAPDCQKGGVYVFDISDPTAPKQINFIRTANDSYAGEGVQAVRLSTKSWTGDLLAFNNEDCLNKSNSVNARAGRTSKHAIGGVTLVDVTNPKVHRYLAEGVGDRTAGPLGDASEADAHEIHSAFVWEDENGTPGTDADDTAYAVLVDNEEAYDVDILDITNPAAPVLIAEYDLNQSFPGIIQPDLGSGESFLHDAVVKQIDGQYVMLLSYWDGGYVALNVDDPANASLLGDSTFPNPDQVLNAAIDPDPNLPPEGNAHQAEFSLDDDFVIGADEDFNAYKPFLSIAGGPPEPFSAGQVSDGVPFEQTDVVTGPTVFLGRACVPVAAAPAAYTIAVVERGACPFQAKIDNATTAGYDAIIVFNTTAGDAPLCEGLVTMLASSTIPAFFVARSVGYDILGIAGYDPANCPAGTNPALPAAGTAGQSVHISFKFDGWGYVRLFDYPSMTELDTYAIPQAHDPAFANGYGDLSVHEVAMSQTRNDLAYFAYYSAGFRVLRIVDDQLVEVGHFIDEGGNNIWGVEVWQQGGKEYVLASDRDYGLYIFEYTGPGAPNS